RLQGYFMDIHFDTKADFTTRWAEDHFPAWEKLLTPLKERNLGILEIGSWEGMSATFFLDFIPNANITCIDTFTRDDGGSERRFDQNMSRFGNRVRKIKGTSFNALQVLAAENARFDLIYVDGSHKTSDVMIDSILSWSLLADDGIMIWDDYRRKKPGQNPGLAVESFSLFTSDCHVFRRGQQAYARKEKSKNNAIISMLAFAYRYMRSSRANTY
ncbi:MAG TPA: class I SAM-dependent methyltransferase, partial [Xanthobacteraceae bacterium]|nr:class I SAM-dependent methyltransferase [Xanthobacteraceae bacterium]